MLKSLLKIIGYVACLAYSGWVFAAGLGGINVSSALGQPLHAEIGLVSVDGIDKSALSAKLASAEVFKAAGLDYPYNLPKLNFQIETRKNGEAIVVITSTQAVNEPFLSLLIELSWPSGQIMREYTFLLDPPGYRLAQPATEELAPVAPALELPPVVTPLPDMAAPEMAAQESLVKPPVQEKPLDVATEVAAFEEVAQAEPAATKEEAVKEVSPATEETPSPARESEVAESAAVIPAPERVVEPKIDLAPMDALGKEEFLAEKAIRDEPVLTKRGDTLSKIALQKKPDDVSLERMLVALYRANGRAFVGKNMNRLRTGRVLRMPEAEELERISQAEAVKEVRVQVADWRVYRQQLAAAPGEVTEQAAKQEAVGAVTTAVVEKKAAEKEPAKEVLKLSKGEAPGDKAVKGGKATQQEKDAKAEEAVAQSKAQKEAEHRAAILEKNLKEMQRLEELKQHAASGAHAAPPVAAAPAASAPAPASAVQPAKPKVVMPAPAPVEEDDALAFVEELLDELLADPMYLAVLAGGLLLLGGAGFAWSRRSQLTGSLKKVASIKKNTKGAVAESAGSIDEVVDDDVFAMAESDNAVSSVSKGAAASNSGGNSEDDVDPIGEADLFLTFGRDVQAEDVLKDALSRTPGNVPVKLKLLSIYSSRKDTNSFYSYAREIKESGDEAAWQEAAKLGLALEPTNPFYGGTPAPAGKSESSSVDFDLGFGDSQPAENAANQKTVSFDISGVQDKTSIISPAELQAALSAPTMDFDVTGTHPPGGLTLPAETESSVMDFDVTSTHQGLASLSGGGESPDVGDLMFDVTSTQDKIPVPAEPDMALDLGISLDFPSSTEATPAPKVEKSDIGLDFGDINLNLDSPLGGGDEDSDGKSEAWHEVATKLDLARAYQEMGDAAGAREILEEVVRDGDDEQRAAGEALLRQL